MPALTPSTSYRVIVAWMRLLLRAFFRRIEVAGEHNVPNTQGTLLVSWHPNGLIDPALVIAHCPRAVVFGARHGLFRYPILGTLLRRIGTVPIRRAIDRGSGTDAQRREANRKAVDALAQRVADGAVSALFPEGDSHDDSNVQRLKTGAAHMYYRARTLAGQGQAPPVIVPVGLHYDEKHVFRSSALVTFHTPLKLPADLDITPPEDEDEATAKQRAADLTDHVSIVLREVVHATEDWNVHHLLHRARRLVRAETGARAGVDPGKTSLQERVFGFAQVRRAYEKARRDAPAKLDGLRKRLQDYDTDLRALGLEDYDLDRSPRLASPWLALVAVAQLVGVFLLLPPLVTIGYAVNVPPALLVLGLTKLASKRVKDEATVKLLAGAILLPLTWVAVAIAAAAIHVQLAAGFRGIPQGAIWTGVLTFVACAVGGAVAVRYVRVARETGRAIAVRITRTRRRIAVARLKVERGELHDELLALVATGEGPPSRPESPPPTAAPAPAQNG